VEDVLKDRLYEIIIIDDNSPDGTGEKVSKISEKNPRLRIIRRLNEKGLSSAVLKGLDAAKGDILGVMDADMSHDENILVPLIEQVNKGVRLAIGSRRVKGGGSNKWPWYRKLTSDIATRLSKSILNVALSDPMSGYFVMDRAFYEATKPFLRSSGYKILLEFFYKGQPEKWVEIPYIFKDRKQGYSKLGPRVIFQFLVMLLTLRLYGRKT